MEKKEGGKREEKVSTRDKWGDGRDSNGGRG